MSHGIGFAACHLTLYGVSTKDKKCDRCYYCAKAELAMDEAYPSSHPRIELRKYPNRRFYDRSRSRHVTLDEIYGMIRAGQDMHVTDSKTGEDITARVLAQIILEHDPLKLSVFPVDLLHQIIRANGPLVRDFVDKYFNQALRAFLDSRRQFDDYLRQTLGLEGSQPLAGELAQMLLGAGGAALFSAFQSASGPISDVDPSPTPSAGIPSHADKRELCHMIRELKDQVAALEQRLKGQAK